DGGPGRRALVGKDPLEQRATLGRGRPAVGRRGEVGRRDTDPQRGACPRAGGGSDDDVGAAGIPVGFALERGEDTGLIGLADDAAGAQHQADRRSLLVGDPAARHGHHPLFTLWRAYSSRGNGSTPHRTWTKGISALGAGPDRPPALLIS